VIDISVSDAQSVIKDVFSEVGEGALNVLNIRRFIIYGFSTA
jgi:hypothetical protein